MDILSVCLLLLALFLIANSKNSTNSKINDLELKILELKRTIDQLLHSRPKEDQPQKAEAASPQPTFRLVEDEPAYKPPVPEPAEITPVPEPVKPEQVERQKEVIDDSLATIKRPIKRSDFVPPTPKEPQPSFFERHPDLEKFIGENLINKIGIAILVLAIGFFVKFAIDTGWVGKGGRVAIGIVCGAILIGIAHWLRNSYKAFSSVLAGGGLAVFYFTVTLAYQQFQLWDQTTAFVILIVITIFAVVLSLLYDKQELAVIALVGGFASPFMVSSGQANYSGLFIYLLILNTGLLIIAYYKAWRVLNIVSFGFTVIVFSTVLYTLTTPTYHIGFVYASIFYVLFFAINVAHNVRQNKTFIASDFSILLINTALYFAAGLYLLTMMHEEQFRGLFCVSLAVVNLILSYILFRNRKVDTNILYLLIGITLTFISLAAPIQLHGNNITIFWASEAVLLYWLYQKSSIQLMKLTALILWVAMLLSLFIDWFQTYTDYSVPLTIIANKGFITTLCAAISSFLLSMLVSKDESKAEANCVMVSKHVFSTAALALLFLSGLLEINHQFLNHYPNTSLNILYIMVYTPVFVYAYYLVSRKIAILNFDEKVRLVILFICVTLYLILTPTFFAIQREMLERNHPPSVLFTWHWVGAIFTGMLIYRIIRLCQKTMDERTIKIFTWVISAGIVLFLSLEISLLSNLVFFGKSHSVDRIETVYIKTGLPILWGVLSFALMWMGMRNKVQVMRIASLTLFSLTLLKLFLFDINNIPVAGKIAAFFCLGIILLVISFMYQKVKKIIVDDEVKDEAKKDE